MKNKIQIFVVKMGWPIIWYLVLFAISYSIDYCENKCKMSFENHILPYIIFYGFYLFFFGLEKYFDKMARKELNMARGVNIELKDARVSEYHHILSKKSSDELIKILKETEYISWISGQSIVLKIKTILLPVITAILIYVIQKIDILTIKFNIASIMYNFLLTFPFIIYFLIYIFDIIYMIHMSMTSSIEKQIEEKLIKKILSKRLDIEI